MSISLASWADPWTKERNRLWIREQALVFAAQSGPYAETFRDLLNKQDYRSLIEFRLDYGIFSDPFEAQCSRQCLAFFQKNQSLDGLYDRKENALRTFFEAEEKCRETNEVFRAVRSGRFYFDRDVAPVLHLAQQKIARCLGPTPNVQALTFAFGPGANTTCRRNTSVRHKFSAALSCSLELEPYLENIMRLFPQWFPPDTEVSVTVTLGKLALVVKDAKTYRTIIVGPILNTFLQKGYGSWLKRRLRAVGVDLRNQTLNQRLARVGSIDGSLATVDKKSASDTNAFELVRDLLPDDHFKILCALRTGDILVEGEHVHLEKFSAMGDAFTFELESLIFWALASSCVEWLGITDRRLAVYGDDVVLPWQAYRLYSKVLCACGFWINTQKSYVAGPFRESCGKDFLNGTDIRPFYVRDTMSYQTLFAFRNRTSRWFFSEYIGKIDESIPNSLRLYGPEGFGDGHLVDPTYRGNLPAKLRKKGYSGFIFDTLALKPKLTAFHKLPGDRLLPTYSIYVKDEGILTDADRSQLGSRDLIEAVCGVRTEASPPCVLETGPTSVDEHVIRKEDMVVRGSRGVRRLSVYTLG